MKGDSRCFSIACASIIAKVTRDRLMHALDARYPTYRWGHNVGYATPDHIAGLAESGLTPHHRRSFMRIRQQLTLDFDAPLEPIIDIPVTADADVILAALESSHPPMPNLGLDVERDARA